MYIPIEVMPTDQPYMLVMSSSQQFKLYKVVY